jgi:hypothetical protein
MDSPSRRCSRRSSRHSPSSRATCSSTSA